MPLFSGMVIADRPRVDNPKAGEVLQGTVKIAGNTDVVGFQSAEIAFGYDKSSTTTWFLIEQYTDPIKDDTLVEWDTTTITDGNYRLLLRVYVEDGRPVDVIVPGLRVRNYMQIETETPAPTMAVVEELPLQSTPVLLTPTALPDNPAEVSSKGMLSSLLKGVFFVIILLVGIGGYFVLRDYIKRR